MKKVHDAGLILASASVALTLALVVGPSPKGASGASHREAPLISLDPAADISDFFMFRSYEPGNEDKVVFIMNVFPNAEPSSGPNYFTFDPGVRYAFNVDNDADGVADDLAISFNFETEIRGVVDALGLPLSYVGNVPPGDGSVIPPITALDGPGSEGLGLRQRYSVTIKQRSRSNFRSKQPLAKGLIAVPANVGPRTMPDYESLAEQGVYDLGHGIRVFAGTRNDPFYIDLGAVFDTLNLRRIPPLLSPAEDAQDDVNPFGFDMLSGFSVQTIAIELPASMVTADGKTIDHGDRHGHGERHGHGDAADATASPKIGAYAATYRAPITIRSRKNPGGSPLPRQIPGVQVQRLANPLVNELIIGTKDKDAWNAQDPENEAQFVGYYLQPRFALALQLVFGFPTGCLPPFASPGCSPSPPAPSDATLANFNRNDLVNVLLKYSPADEQLSELLRLDLSVPPTPLAEQSRLTVLAGDNAGWPNGRRPKDDVTDIAVRVVGGPLYLENRAGDGVNTDIVGLPATFPFISIPSDGRNLEPEPHVDPTP